MPDKIIKPNVAVFRSNFLPYSETFIHDELRNHIRYNVTVFARTWRNADRFPGHDVVFIEKEPGFRNRAEYIYYRNFRKSWTFDRVLSKKPFMLIHAHFGYDGIYALPFAQKYNLPLIVSFWGHDVTILAGQEKFLPKWERYWRHYKQMEQEAGAFLCVSDDLRRMMIDVGCPPEKLHVQPQGIDLSRFRADRKNSDVFQVLMVGRFVEKKGFEYGIDAFAKAFKDRNAELIIVGEGPRAENYKSLANKYGLNGRLRFTGNQTTESVIEILQQASVLMAPSITASSGDKEGLPTVIKEAMACGLPVIASRHGGIPEIISDGVEGFLTEERDADALARCLVQLSENRSDAHRMGRAGRRKIEEDHDVVKLNERLELIYDDVIKRHREKAPYIGEFIPA